MTNYSSHISVVISTSQDWMVWWLLVFVLHKKVGRRLKLLYLIEVVVIQHSDLYIP
jgi:hypothetical protein